MEKVSIIIPAYNKAELTIRTIESVLKQTYKNIEIIVIDDGSTDHTQQALAVYEGKIRYIYKDNGGACSARNLGIKLATGEFIGILDCDDLYCERKIELSMKYLTDHPEFDIVHTAAYFIDGEDKIIGQYSHPKSRKQGVIANRLIMGNFICNSTVIIRKKCFDEVGVFDETFFTPADWDMWIRLAEKFKVGYLDIPLSKYRVTDNYIFSKLELSREEEFKVIKKFVERNPMSRGLLKHRALSNLHLRYAQCYLLKDNVQQLKLDFILSLKENPFNMKALLFLCGYIFNRTQLRAILEKRILRYS
ncbi:MAG: glycosyltransferase [Candidatus Omnitrophica bacterium]|nr:glycosyltransferase [Candidatus Omnitrophota bacterium]MCB9748184.1 glycosyltransferase [Candidatus Omnitrophota bacterium]